MNELTYRIIHYLFISIALIVSSVPINTRIKMGKYYFISRAILLCIAIVVELIRISIYE